MRVDEMGVDGKESRLSGMTPNKVTAKPVRARFHDQRFPPKSLPKIHALQSTVRFFMGL